MKKIIEEMEQRKKITLIAAIVALLTVFFPWTVIEGSASVFGHSVSQSAGPFKGIEYGGGIFALLVILAGGFMVFKNIRWAGIAGILNSIIGLGFIFGIFGGYGPGEQGSAAKAMGVDISSHAKFGLYLFFISSAVFLYYTYKDLELKELYNKYVKKTDQVNPV